LQEILNKASKQKSEFMTGTGGVGLNRSLSAHFVKFESCIIVAGFSKWVGGV